MLAVIKKAQGQGHIKLSNRVRVEVIDRHPAIINIHSLQFPHKCSLTNQITLRIDPEDAGSASSFGLLQGSYDASVTIFSLQGTYTF